MFCHETDMTHNIVFMGTPDFAVEALKALLQNPLYRVVCIYTQPPRPAGRGHQLTPSAVHAYAASQDIEVRTPLSLKAPEEQEKFRALNADLAIVAAYGLILPAPILEAPRLGCLNIHASLLPRWRGAAPIQRAIEAGDTKTGITLMQMDVGLDTGAMLAVKEISITPKTTGKTLHDTLAELGATLLMETLPAYMAGEIHPTPQPLEGITYAHKVDKQEGLLDWMQEAETLFRKMRALTPAPGVWFFFKGMRIKIHDAVTLPSSFATPGTVLNNQLHIACGKGTFCPLLLQKEGGKPLPLEEFLRGFSILPGTCLL
jgi:methionyl-tRNA formyltransferase